MTQRYRAIELPELIEREEPRMPTYDFRCTSCTEEFEVTRPMRATNDECCPSCGAPAIKIFAPVTVAFKGSGFHNTDYLPKPVDTSSDAPKPAPACPAATSGGAGCASCPAAATVAE